MKVQKLGDDGKEEKILLQRIPRRKGNAQGRLISVDGLLHKVRK